MPFKSEKIKIAGTSLDMRVKLTPEQRKAVKDLSISSGYSQRKLAEIFNVSKGTIQNIVSPSVRKFKAKRRPTEYWTLKKKKYRHRKQQLYLSGRIKHS